jgi:hypothetical protein
MAQTHQPLLESLRLEVARERLLDDEDDVVTALAEHVANADAVVRRPKRTLWEERDRRHCAILWV